MSDSLLQPPLRGDARMEALARLIARLSALPVATPLVNLMDVVEASALPLLGEQFHVMGDEGWNLATTTEARRELLKQAIELHRHKGTPWAVRQALETVIGLTAEVREWFSYGGEPYFFRVFMDVSGVGFTGGLDALRLIHEYKNVRSWLDYLETHTTQELRIHGGVGLRSRTAAVICRPWFREPAPLPLRERTALALSGITACRTWSRFAQPVPLRQRQHTGVRTGGRTESRIKLHFSPGQHRDVHPRVVLGVISLTTSRVGCARAPEDSHA